MSDLDLDELDRLHAALPELEANSWLSDEDSGAALVIAAVLAEDDSEVEVAEERAQGAVAILRAYPALAAEIRALRAASEETESAMHMRIRSGYDRTIADCWRAKLAERDAEILALREVVAAAEAYRACREGVQTQGAQNTLDRRTTAARLAEALAKVPR